MANSNSEECETSINESMKKKDESLPCAFKKLMKDNGIKDKTTEILIQNDIDSVNVLSTLSFEDICNLGLSLGQRNLLRKCVDATRMGTSSQDSQKQPDSGITVAAAKSVIDSATKASKESNGEFLPNIPLGAKPSYPVPRPFQFIEGKKSYGELTLSEHMYGALLILENMLASSDPNAMAYTRHISFLALKSSQQFSSDSILAYDNALRCVVESTGKWPRDSDVHLANCHLVRSTRAFPKPKDKRSKPLGDNPLNNRCIRYNTGTCNSGERCRYEHKCITCNGSHPMSSCKSMPKSNKQ